MPKLKDKIEKLPPELQNEVDDFVNFLIEKNKEKKKSGELKFDWAGELSELKGKYTSVELQHKILEMRSGKNESVN